MTAALVHLTGPGMRSRCRGFGARLLTVLALVLPIPVFAVLGLSLPLPATVQRIAAELVPFGNAESPAIGADGVIVLVPGDQQSQGDSAERDRSSATIARSAGVPAEATTGPRAHGPSAETGAGATAPAGNVRGTAPTDDGRLSSAPSNSSTPTTPTSETTTTPPGGGSEPAKPTLVDTATGAANDAVNTAATAVTDTVGPPVDAVTGVVDSAEGAANDVLGPVKP